MKILDLKYRLHLEENWWIGFCVRPSVNLPCPVSVRLKKLFLLLIDFCFVRVGMIAWLVMEIYQ